MSHKLNQPTSSGAVQALRMPPWMSLYVSFDGSGPPTSASSRGSEAWLKNSGLKPVIRLVNESFEFEGGEVLTATRAFIYPVIINDHLVEVDIAEVPGNCPGGIGSLVLCFHIVL